MMIVRRDKIKNDRKRIFPSLCQINCLNKLQFGHKVIQFEALNCTNLLIYEQIAGSDSKNEVKRDCGSQS